MTDANQGFEFRISREFDAPRELMWRLWTDPAHLAKWWGPKGFVVHHCTVDLKPGGPHHYGMRSPDGLEMWGKFVFRAIEPPSRLEFLTSFSDPEGGDTVHPLHAEWPRRIHSVVTFVERAGRTTVTVQWRAHEATAAERRVFEDGASSMQQGWTGTFENLEGYLARR